MSNCSLCAASGVALVNSHIIPKSFFGAMLTDPSGPMRILSTAPLHRPVRSRTGEYDQIVCRSCEREFAKVDSYAHEILFRQRANRHIYHQGETLASIYDSADTHKVLMFFVSLLWRMHVSRRPMFSKVDLGAHAGVFAESIKTMTCHIPAFDVVLTKFDVPTTPVLGPTRLRINGINGYRVCFSGYTSWLKVDQRPYPSDFQGVSLRTSTELTLLRTDFLTSPERRASVRIVRGGRPI